MSGTTGFDDQEAGAEECGGVGDGGALVQANGFKEGGGGEEFLQVLQGWCVGFTAGR